MKSGIKTGIYDDIFRELYALDGKQESLEAAKNRAAQVIQQYQLLFDKKDDDPAALFSGPGRTEIGGNHTDHQQGHVLCGSINLDMLACAAPNNQAMIRVCSEGYPMLEVDVTKLQPIENERNTSAALVRGIVAQMTKLGYALSGFDAYVTSDVLSGSGLSSSAAYEVLICNILNSLFCHGELDAIQIAKVSQYAERFYFGKPCGLMDQMGASIGGAVTIDFEIPEEPVVRKVDYSFARSDHALCIVDTGSCHADLTDDYAEITHEMQQVAAYFEKNVLREVEEMAFLREIAALREQCGDRAVLRAMHYFDDDRRAVEEAEALAHGNFSHFLQLVNESGLSSSLNLQNIWSVSSISNQAVSVALAIGRKLLNGEGAIRVHGGGFAGTIQAFVPNEKLNDFKAGMESVFGAGRCHVLYIRPQGGCLVIG